MKKALSIAVSAAMLFSLSACGSNETIAETPSPTATELQASVETAAVDSSMFTKRDSSTDYDASGNVLLSYTPADDYSCIVVSCPELSEGSEYTLSYGSASQSFTQSEAHVGSALNVPAGGFGGMGGNIGGGFDKSRRP